MSDSPSEMSILGQDIADLVLEYDNRKGYEFRVQCEVVVKDVKDGAALFALLAADDAVKLGAAKQLVLSHVHPRATAGFKKIISDAFDENAERLKARMK